jgi:hypothetical protein
VFSKAMHDVLWFSMAFYGKYKRTPKNKYYLLFLGINEMRRPIVPVMIMALFIAYEIRKPIVIIIFVFTIRL